MKQCHIPREVVRFLGAFSIVGLVGLLLLAGLDKAVPEGLLTLVASAVGAVGAILSSTRNVQDPQPVHVTNTPKEALPVEEVQS